MPVYKTVDWLSGSSYVGEYATSPFAVVDVVYHSVHLHDSFFVWHSQLDPVALHLPKIFQALVEFSSDAVHTGKVYNTCLQVAYIK